jgi:hypothetical protein
MNPPRARVTGLTLAHSAAAGHLNQVELVVIGITSVRARVAGAGYFRTQEQEVTRAPQPCQEIPLEQVSGGALARMWPD